MQSDITGEAFWVPLILACIRLCYRAHKAARGGYRVARAWQASRRAYRIHRAVNYNYRVQRLRKGVGRTGYMNVSPTRRNGYTSSYHLRSGHGRRGAHTHYIKTDRNPKTGKKYPRR